MLKRHSLAEQAYQTLLTDIMSGKHTSGEKLTEEGICRKFKISRTPAREALLRLDRDGLVVRSPRSGWNVSKLNKELIQQLFECRREIECAALRKAIDHIPEADLLKVKACLKDDTKDIRQRSLKADEMLHSLIATYCDNKFLSEILEKLLKQTAPYRFFRTGSAQNPNTLLDERLKLVECIHAKDAKEACAKLSEHIEQGAKLFN